MKIVTGQQMARIDQKAIQELGVPGPVLMENAARALCRVFADTVSGGERPAVAVLCGSGNNGGDGFCAARILSGWNFQVFPVLVGRVQSLKPDARLNFELLEKYGIDVLQVHDEEHLAELEEILGKSEWVIDAIFGTGLSRPIKGIAGKVLSMVSDLDKKVLAVDIPSGVNSDTGEIPGNALRADLTVTFGLPKWGHVLFPGAECTGELVVADIGFPPGMMNDEEIKGEITTVELVKKHLPSRKLNAHKGNCGKLGIIAGCRHYLGAAILCAKAALKMGTGYITLLLPNYLEPVSKIALPDVVTLGLSDIDGGFITVQAVDVVLEHTRDKDAVALGPGLGRHATTRDFVRDFLEDNPVPLILDADGINNMAGFDEMERDMGVPWIITPHPGEAARLLNIPTERIVSNPLESARRLADKFHAVVVLKGARTLIVDYNGKVFVNSTGNPGMAVLGMGDVLTGMISSLSSRGVPPFEAAACGVYLHGLAGDLTAEELGMDSVTASDVVERIPRTLGIVRGRTEPPRDKVILPPDLKKFFRIWR